ncbi:MAG: tRNA (cytidine(34)-2'-O)-methyltransferase [Pseudomonadota bacterium]|nr:tRNA (cytidine(34)-2'-O)-methyltransferase [Pseudomonadota bacterium]
MPDLVLFQPDIPGNTGTLMRLAACTATTLHIVEPAGFRLDDTALKRAGMDYLEIAAIARHIDWDAFEAWRERSGRRLVLMSTSAGTGLWDFTFRAGDLVMLGRESGGVPPKVHEAADCRLKIAMASGARSLNVALAGAMALGEALRQTANG